MPLRLTTANVGAGRRGREDTKHPEKMLVKQSKGILHQDEVNIRKLWMEIGSREWHNVLIKDTSWYLLSAYN
jgi:hypothetical protein